MFVARAAGDLLVLGVVACKAAERAEGGSESWGRSNDVYFWKGAPKAHCGKATSSAPTREVSSAMTGRFHKGQ